MRTTRLYVPVTTLTCDSPVGSHIGLDKDASRYLTNVLRFKPGDRLVLFNGDGKDYAASIIDTGKSVQVEITAATHNNAESPVAITLVQSLAKGTKLDLVIQKATELGAVRISPVSTERTVLRVDEKRSERKLEHWNKVASSACAQSQRSVIPVIDPVIELTQWLTTHSGEQSVMIHPGAEQTFGDLELQTRMNIIVGPEGGFSEQELQLAKSTQVNVVRCGPRVLRTETAGFAAIAIVQSLMGDMG